MDVEEFSIFKSSCRVHVAISLPIPRQCSKYLEQAFVIIEFETVPLC